MQNEKKNYRHLTYKDRTIIAYALNNNATFTAISNTIGKNKSTISREIQKNFSIIKPNPFNNPIANFCVKKTTCKITNLCPNCTERVSVCSFCKKCNKKCPEFDPICPKLKKAPYVCNGCKRKNQCAFEKHIYDADKAEDIYQATLSSSRSNTLKKSTFVKELDKVLTPHIENGKSIHNFLMTHPNINFVSPRTVYRWVKDDYFSIKFDDMPSRRKTKPSKDYAYPRPKAKNILTNRTYEDYLKRVKLGNFYETVQIDTVLGVRGNKVAILTIYFIKTKLLLAYLLRNKTVNAIKDAFWKINKDLEKAEVCFGDLAPVILLDNGSEFAEPLVLEADNYGEIRSSVFYCTPYTASQRPQIERAHVELRKFLPKGTSFENLTQEQLNSILSHLNSYKLKSLNAKSPYETFAFVYGEKVLSAIGIKHIPDHDIVRNHKAFQRLLNNIN